MTFTDDDLKRLKRDIEIGGVVWKAPFFGPLIARLEAAEAYINSMPEDVTDENCALHKEWRKSCGRDE